VSAKIHGLLDEADIYRTVREEFAKSEQYDAGIFLLTDDASKLRIKETSESRRKFSALERATGLRLKGFEIDLDNSRIYSQVVREGKTLQANVRDLVGELFPRPLAYLVSKTMGYERKKSIFTPLKRHGKIIGVLAVTSTELTKHFIPSVKNLAQHISTALEQADQLAKRKQMEEELRDSEERWRSLIELAPDGIATMSMRGVVTSVNTAFLGLTGFSEDEIVGRHFTKIGTLQVRALPKYIKIFSSILRGKIPPPVEFVFRRKDGTEGWGESRISLIKVGDKEREILTISRDVTERKRMERELRSYSEHLEELVEERARELKEAQERLIKAERMAAIGETAAMVGHDLRNPLQVIINTLYLARQKLGSLNIKEREILENQGFFPLLKRIGRQVEYMNKIVSDLQDYARPVKPQLVETSLHQLVDDTLSTIAVPETLKISVAVEEGFPKLMVDPALMKRVLINLITNALQAMPDGGRLTVGASRAGEVASISIQDTGVGIPEENLLKLFQPLFTTKAKGQGFGLAACIRIVEAHGGTIAVESEVGRGSTFTVKIPLKGR